MSTNKLPAFVRSLNFADKAQAVKDYVLLNKNGGLNHDATLRRLTCEFLEVIGSNSKECSATWMNTIAHEINLQFAEHFLAATGTEGFEQPEHGLDEGYFYAHSGENLWRISHQDVEKDIAEWENEVRDDDPIERGTKFYETFRNGYLLENADKIQGWEPVFITSEFNGVIDKLMSNGKSK